MSLNTSNKAIIEQRRAFVANLRVKGATQREIVNNLAKNNIVNPKTQKPWSLGIINADIEATENLWKESANKDISEHKSRQLAELAEIKRKAWLKEDYPIILKAIDQEANIVGTKAAIKQEHTGKDGDPIEFTDTAAKARLLARLAEEAAEEGSGNTDSDTIQT